ncbi:MAG: DUF2332 domain-containing protein [Chloroflexota bacterium]|nr:DUF2332 domain-containing protein [Chloroflexota bacterium]
MSDPSPDRVADIAGQFSHWAAGELRETSPLYARLAQGIAADPDLPTLAATARSSPVPHLFMGAVQYLLADHRSDPLAAFYPNLTDPPATGDPYPAFRAFCLAHGDALTAILQTRRVQTNEVRRCACLLPAFSLVAQQAAGRPLALIEIGASAGFNLLWDRYGYDYGAAGRTGDLQAALQLQCEVRGDHSLPIPAQMPTIASRLGIDLHPINARDPDAVAWLRALIWPEHATRFQLLDQAVTAVQTDPPELWAGDALDLLPRALATVPMGTVPCVFHSFTLNQFTPAGRVQVAAILAATGAARDLAWIGIEGGLGQPYLTLLSWRASCISARPLARCNPHGGWIEWLA